MAPDEPATLRAFQALVLAVLFAVLIGHLLVVGKAILLPIFVAVISVFVLVSASDWLGRQPLTRGLPLWARRTLVLVAFVLAIAALTTVIVQTAGQVLVALPGYQTTLEGLGDRVFHALGLDLPEDWNLVWASSLGQIDLQGLARTALGSVGTLGGVIFLVAIYAAFLMAERGGFAYKIALALPGRGGDSAQDILASINRRIGDYLAVKTLINVILGAISFVAMWLFRIDFALFWAILIGLLNYIPFVGSLIGVAFPVALTLAQFGSLQITATVLVLLTAAQMLVGNVIEPRMIGRRVNLSPFVVLVSLSLWTSLWGVAGSILAIPLTSILVIVASHFDITRPIAILLADDPDLSLSPEP